MKQKNILFIITICILMLIRFPAAAAICIVSAAAILFITGSLPTASILMCVFFIPFAWAEGVKNGVLFAMALLIITIIYFAAFVFFTNYSSINNTSATPGESAAPVESVAPGESATSNTSSTRLFGRKKRLINTPLCLLVVAFVLFAQISDLVCSFALYPKFTSQFDFSKSTDTSNQSIGGTSSMAEAYIKKQSATINAFIDSLPEDCSNTLTMESSDGFTLVGQEFLQSEPSDKWAFIIHGYTSRKEQMYPYAIWFYEQGYNCFLPDLRAHGQSQGDYIGMSLPDHFDCIDWINLIIKEHPDARFVLMGQSMGAATVNYILGEDIPTNVVCAISDCGYTTTREMMNEKCGDWFHLPPVFVDTVRLALLMRGGYDLFDSNPIEGAKKNTRPILYIHGTADELVPFYMVNDFYAVQKAPKRLFTVEGAGHCRSRSVQPEEYDKQMLDFINEYIK